MKKLFFVFTLIFFLGYSTAVSSETFFDMAKKDTTGKYPSNFINSKKLSVEDILPFLRDVYRSPRTDPKKFKDRKILMYGIASEGSKATIYYRWFGTVIGKEDRKISQTFIVTCKRLDSGYWIVVSPNVAPMYTP